MGYHVHAWCPDGIHMYRSLRRLSAAAENLHVCHQGNGTADSGVSHSSDECEGTTETPPFCLINYGVYLIKMCAIYIYTAEFLRRHANLLHIQSYCCKDRTMYYLLEYTPVAYPLCANCAKKPPRSGSESLPLTRAC